MGSLSFYEALSHGIEEAAYQVWLYLQQYLVIMVSFKLQVYYDINIFR